MKTVIIEDEQKSLAVLKDLISKYTPELEICGTAGYVNKAVELIESSQPELVFLDVRIADGTSFDILSQINERRFEVIFISAYDDYALDAFRVAAVDYLLKPVSILQLQEAVNRARKRLTDSKRSSNIDALLKSLATQTDHDKKVKIPTLTGYEFIDVADIIWCKSEGHYTTFYLLNKYRLMSSKNLGYYEDLLTKYNFYRINNNIMINVNQIKSYVKGKGGYVVMEDGTELEISQRRKQEFLQRLSL